MGFLIPRPWVQLPPGAPFSYVFKHCINELVVTIIHPGTADGSMYKIIALPYGDAPGPPCKEKHRKTSTLLKFHNTQRTFIIY